MNLENLTVAKSAAFSAKINLHISVGRFTIRTISAPEELAEAFRLRFQVFQVEKAGSEISNGVDHDEFDFLSDHLAIFETKTNQMIATCRLNCSLFSNRFYSEQEFNCASLLNLVGTKMEIGRVCVQREFRKGIIVMLLWRAIAEYMKKSESRYLFGCGSVETLNAKDAVILYRYLEEEKKINLKLNITPTEKFRSVEFDRLLLEYQRPLQSTERQFAENLLPSLCRSYFDIGCFTPGAPAFDFDFKCIDFLTILDVNDLDRQVRRKMFGES